MKIICGSPNSWLLRDKVIAIRFVAFTTFESYFTCHEGSNHQAAFSHSEMNKNLWCFEFPMKYLQPHHPTTIFVRKFLFPIVIMLLFFIIEILSFLCRKKLLEILSGNVDPPILIFVNQKKVRSFKDKFAKWSHQRRILNPFKIYDGAFCENSERI